MRVLPAELREEIWKYCDLEWQGQMPALIIALRARGLEDWYQQALEIFNKRSFFYLHTWNKYSIKGMSKHAVSMIRKIDLSIE